MWAPVICFCVVFAQIFLLALLSSATIYKLITKNSKILNTDFLNTVRLMLRKENLGSCVNNAGFSETVTLNSCYNIQHHWCPCKCLKINVVALCNSSQSTIIIISYSVTTLWLCNTRQPNHCEKYFWSLTVFNYTLLENKLTLPQTTDLKYFIFTYVT